ncbi:MAG TPA: hypothetical protein ACFCUY_13045 [Xenococcaceae cyanobacterium]
MLSRVRKFLKNNSPDWLNTEVNKNLLQNLTTSLSQGSNEYPNKSQITDTLISSSSFPSLEEVKSNHIKSKPGEVRRSQKKSYTKDRQLSTTDSSLFPTPGTPHWRRIRQVFQALDTAPENATYNQLIEYVRETTGKGCSRKLISKWKKYRQNPDLLPVREERSNESDRQTNIVSVSPAMTTRAASPVPCNQIIERELSSVNSFQLNQSVDNSSNNDSLNSSSFLPIKTWSYLAAAGITIALVGCELVPLTSDRPTENIAIASITAPITPLPPRPERRNRLEPRNIKIELTLSNPQDLKVKPGDKISAGQTLSDRADERNRLQAKKKQLQISLEKLNLPLTPIPQPKPIPEIAELPPVSYAESEAAIKLKQQQLIEAKRAIALQQKKIDSLTQLQASPSHRSKGEGNLKLVIEHERANLKNLEAAQQSAQIQLEVAQSKLTTAKERRAYIEYQRQLEQTRRAIAIEQRNQAIASQESERERLLAEREYSQAQIETQIQTLDYQIEQLSTVRAPYEGTIEKVKWTGQSDHNLTAVVTLAVTSDRSTIVNSTDKPTPTTEVREAKEGDK